MGSHEGLSASNPVDEMDIGINEVRISTDLPIGPPSAGLAMQMHLSSRPRLTCCGGCARQLCGFKGHAGEVDDRLRNAAVEQAMLDVASITNTAALRYASTLAPKHPVAGCREHPCAGCRLLANKSTSTAGIPH